MTAPKSSPGPIIAILCLAEVLGMAGNSTFPALLPGFRALWGLSNAEAGWINGIYYGGYVAAVPLLVSLTDRFDARAIYLASTLLGALAALAFALLAEGFWSALALRALGGVGLAGTYMVGLRLLTDRLQGRWESRGVALYTGHYSIGASLSVLLAGEVAAAAGWRWAFAVAGLAGLAALLLVALAVPRSEARPRLSAGHPLDLRPAFANRAALAYNLGYACHVWELFGVRAWIVAFLVFVLARHGQETLFGLSPTQAATLWLLLGMPASFAGAEAALRLGRRRIITWVMLASGLASAVLGFAAALPPAWIVLLLLLYAGLVMGDSAALTTGAVLTAEPARKGATMAVHALLGFGAGFLAPLAFGLLLDLGGGEGQLAGWGLAFAALGAGAALGPLLLRRVGPG